MPHALLSDKLVIDTDGQLCYCSDYGCLLSIRGHRSPYLWSYNF